MPTTTITRAKNLKSAIARLKRESRLTAERGRQVKAWRVAGTPEAGILRQLESDLRKLLAAHA